MGVALIATPLAIVGLFELMSRVHARHVNNIARRPKTTAFAKPGRRNNNRVR
jgi:hypothetical protein